MKQDGLNDASSGLGGAAVGAATVGVAGACHDCVLVNVAYVAANPPVYRFDVCYFVAAAT